MVFCIISYNNVTKLNDAAYTKIRGVHNSLTHFSMTLQYCSVLLTINYYTYLQCDTGNDNEHSIHWLQGWRRLACASQPKLWSDDGMSDLLMTLSTLQKNSSICCFTSSSSATQNHKKKE